IDIHQDKEGDAVTVTFEPPRSRVSVEIHWHRLIVSSKSHNVRFHEVSGNTVREGSLGKFSRFLQLPVDAKVRSSTRWCERAVLMEISNETVDRNDGVYWHAFVSTVFMSIRSPRLKEWIPHCHVDQWVGGTSYEKGHVAPNKRFLVSEYSLDFCVPCC
ncbi:hypothetical protein PISMIDRAFT_104589, partial [Pisolithus microcarpus 441]